MGNPRRFSAVAGGVLFVLDDTFGANLDPTEHSDGTYRGADAAWIAEEMAKYPDLPTVLMAHHFEPARESEEFSRLVESPRVRLLLSGHVHTADVSHPFAKPLIHAGQYSYSKEADGLPHHGFVELEYARRWRCEKVAFLPKARKDTRVEANEKFDFNPKQMQQKTRSIIAI